MTVILHTEMTPDRNGQCDMDMRFGATKIAVVIRKLEYGRLAIQTVYTVVT